MQIRPEGRPTGLGLLCALGVSVVILTTEAPGTQRVLWLNCGDAQTSFLVFRVVRGYTPSECAMPTFGDYETVGEPVATRDERGHVSTVWQARKSGASSGRLYATKCYSPHRREPKEGQTEEARDEERSQMVVAGIKQLKKAHSEGR